MDIEKIKASYREFQQKNAGFDKIAILTREGGIEYADEGFITADEAKSVMDAWLTNKPAIEVGGNRFPILKWDELQFASRNTSGMGAIIGCITKSKLFFVAFLLPNTNSNLIAATVALNRWSWNIIE